jgi:glycosyltransferase involved in cell wall biosynthesis
MGPVISVITSCYNASKYLCEAVDSVINQTFKDFEYILIDDGSIDETAEIIRGYARKDNRIVVIEKANTGLTDSLNVGLRTAKGTWIARLDADDVALCKRFETQINFLTYNPKIVLLGSACFVIDDTGRYIKRKSYPTENDILCKRLENNGTTFPHSSVLFRTDLARRLGGYRIRLEGAEDRDLWLRLSVNGKIASLDEPLIKLRKHSESITSGNLRSLLISFAAMISYKLQKQNFPDPIGQDENHFNEFIQWLEGRLEQQGWPEEVRLFFEIEKRRYAKPGIKTLIEILGLVNNRHGFNLVKERIFGSDNANRLTRDWIKFKANKNNLGKLTTDG